MENIDVLNWAIVFTDLKDFTLKTSLLTQKQIDNLLNNQDSIILNWIEKYSWTLIKTIGDSYMIFFDDIKNSLNFAIQVQNETSIYNNTKTLKLQKIEIRISMNYWSVNKKNTTNWFDYFWDTVNLASRVLSKTLENKIFITDKFYEKIKEEKWNTRFILLWKTSFKWILYEVLIYNVLYSNNDIEDFDNWIYKKIDYSNLIMDEKVKNRYKNIEDIIFKWSCVNAIFWVQPIPFFDIYSSIAVYIYMLKKIASEYNIKLWKNDVKEILVTIFSAIWWVIAINQTINWVSKIWLLWFSWFLLVPLNFATSYWVWKVINRYFYNRTKDLNFTNEEIKELFLSSKDYGLNYAKNNKKEIINIWNSIKNDFLKFSDKTKKEFFDLSFDIKSRLKK
jgi:uncharacterized protein (DUF697 family)